MGACGAEVVGVAYGGPHEERGRSRGGCLRTLAILVAVLLLVLVIAGIVIAILLIANAPAVLSWLNGVLQQLQQLPLIGGGGGGG